MNSENAGISIDEKQYISPGRSGAGIPCGSNVALLDLDQHRAFGGRDVRSRVSRAVIDNDDFVVMPARAGRGANRTDGVRELKLFVKCRNDERQHDRW